MYKFPFGTDKVLKIHMISSATYDFLRLEEGEQFHISYVPRKLMMAGG